MEGITRFKRGFSKSANRPDAETEVDVDEVNEILMNFERKRERSGYPKFRRSEIFKAGLLGYKRKGQRMLDTSGFSKHQLGCTGSGLRKLSKMADKTRWYKKTKLTPPAQVLPPTAPSLLPRSQYSPLETKE